MSSGPPPPKKFSKIKVRLAKNVEVPTPEEEKLTIVPSLFPADEALPQEEQAIRTFFKKPSASKPQEPKPQEPSPAIVPSIAKPAIVPSAAKPAIAPSAAKPFTKPLSVKPVVQEESKEEPSGLEFEGTELEDLATAILEEEKKSPHAKNIQTFVPQTNRGFAEFIRQNYSEYALPPPPSEPDYDACMKMGASGSQKAEIYQYQQFVRDYMSWSSPYRGILVYHGLGSGKTCTAIAAAEALYATANRRIIVMTPFSLRKNFVKEITFCGFRHFRLQNHWLSYPNDPINEPLVRLFASKVLGIPIKYLKKAKQIWIPDFEKESNYLTLSSDEQTQIREQLQQTIVYDPKKGLEGRIWFINYNGVTPSSLKELACQKQNPFDNAVIVVDEIHNLIRSMQSTIEPYLSNLKGVKRKISPEPITPGQWTPALCGKPMGYKRSYLLYRLLSGATGSKIIGLSGTPLINFPEELGILANVLHGYLHIGEFTIVKGADDSAVKSQIESIAKENLYIDFYEVIIETSFIKVNVTTLPEGIRKVKGGVERIPFGENALSFAERIENFKADLLKNRIKVTGPVQTSSVPLLPPEKDQFRGAFIDQDGVSIQNLRVLQKRLTGLVSYYKGSRKELMPQVTKDEVVYVPFSEYHQKKYSEIRLEEITIEMKKKKEDGGLSGLWAEIYEVKSAKQNSNYRMASRQASNFVFPNGIVRPRPRDKDELTQEIGKDVDDIVDAAAEEEGDDALSVVLEEDEAQKEEAEKEEKELEEDEEAVELVKDKDLDASEALTPEQKKCRVARFPGETYNQAILRVKDCLTTVGKEKLLIDAGLNDVSPKFNKIATNIRDAKGTSLVYSQFLSMEGVDIFCRVLMANGYDPIEIDLVGGPHFTEKTEASLRLGPDSKKMRFIKFTGGEKDEVRKFAIAVFNAKFSELPKTMADVLNQSGYTGNQIGELCRVFCITAAGAEGLSLKNVRAVHIMEPYWNDIRMAQVKGRAVRICSHMDIQPPSERTVEIFTYISVFGPEAQVVREGPMKIAEQIILRDSLTPDEAKLAGLPIPEKAGAYVMTSDERLWVISQRKKALIDNLTKTMKSVAVDCQLNFAENNDGTYKCALFGKVGDFMYHPNLIKDISLTQEEYGSKQEEEPTQKVATVGKVIKAKIGQTQYFLKQIVDPETKKALRYDLYDAVKDAGMTKVVGKIDADPATGRPVAGTAIVFKK